MHFQIIKVNRLVFQPNRILKNSLKVKNCLILPTKHYSSTNTACWKCGASSTLQSDPFCPKCKALQHPVQRDNYFRLLGLEERFEIDQSFLRDNFRKLQSLVHPDKFENRTHEEQKISEEYSALANKAFSSLQPPLKRAEHLLALKGQALSEEESVDDPDFLMEIMTLNEEIDDADTDVKKLKVLEVKNTKMLEDLSKEISYHFKIKDTDSVKKSIVKLKYFSSINNRLNSIFRELGITD